MPSPDEDASGTLADRFLEHAQEARTPVSIYLMSGFQLKGQVVGYDEATILFSHKGAHQLLMRSAVASMYPVLDDRQDASEWWRAHLSASP